MLSFKENGHKDNLFEANDVCEPRKLVQVLSKLGETICFPRLKLLSVQQRFYCGFRNFSSH